MKVNSRGKKKQIQIDRSIEVDRQVSKDVNRYRSTEFDWWSYRQISIESNRQRSIEVNTQIYIVWQIEVYIFQQIKVHGDPWRQMYLEFNRQVYRVRKKCLYAQMGLDRGLRVRWIGLLRLIYKSIDVESKISRQSSIDRGLWSLIESGIQGFINKSIQFNRYRSLEFDRQVCRGRQLDIQIESNRKRSRCSLIDSGL